MNIMNRAVTSARALLAGFVLLSVCAAASADVELKEGVNYKLLSPAQPTNVAPGKVEVVEVFWYGCGHCYMLEPKLDAWNKTGRPAYVELVRMPATWNETLKTHARLFYATEQLGRLPQLHSEIFREMHLRGNHLDTPESIEAFFTARGVSKTDFQKAFASFNTESKVRRADDMSRRYRITGTPTVIVNGKYSTDVGMAGSEAKLFEVINALAAKERGKT
jgi:thiol:disulfide interchange protein DsbA